MIWAANLILKMVFVLRCCLKCVSKIIDNWPLGKLVMHLQGLGSSISIQLMANAFGRRVEWCWTRLDTMLNDVERVLTPCWMMLNAFEVASVIHYLYCSHTIPVLNLEVQPNAAAWTLCIWPPVSALWGSLTPCSSFLAHGCYSERYSNFSDF